MSRELRKGSGGRFCGADYIVSSSRYSQLTTYPKDMKLYNTAKKKKEEFKPLKEGEIGVYSCGPTVYWNQHIGHMYAYVQWDTMVKFLRHQGFKVKWVMNITDVGHMTGDNLGDADTGEDKMERGAKREGKTVWQIAEKYIKQFTKSMDLLNVTRPDVMSRATEHIEEQISLIKKIEANGFTYKTKTGLVFDTGKFKDYAKFAKLDLKKQRAGARVEIDEEKKSPEDFLLWVTNKPNHIMQWDSPWGRGFPGWHIECTAMGTKYLGDKFDIHTGGLEHIPVHHTNEIAQVFGAFKDSAVNYWLHNAWLTLKGEKMSKSLGNMVTVQDLVKKGYDPMHFRYLVLTSHYKKGLVFSFDALDGARVAYEKLVVLMRAWRERGRSTLSEEKIEKINNFREEFVKKANDDLNFPEALAVLWKAAKSNIPNTDKLDLVLEFDQVLGLRLNERSFREEIPAKVQKLIKKREKLREENKFEESDKIREKISELGYATEDSKEGTRTRKRQ